MNQEFTWTDDSRTRNVRLPSTSSQRFKVSSVPDDEGNLSPITIDNLVSVLPEQSVEVYVEDGEWRAREFSWSEIKFRRVPLWRRILRWIKELG